MIKTIKICACKEKTKCLKRYIFRIFEKKKEKTDVYSSPLIHKNLTLHEHFFDYTTFDWETYIARYLFAYR